MGKLEISVAVIKSELTNLKEQNTEEHNNICKKLDETLDRKANKWVENAFWWVISVLAFSNVVAIYLATKG